MMAVRWDLHRDAARAVLMPVGKAATVLTAAIGFVAVVSLAVFLFGALGAIAVLASAIIIVWYWAEYHEAKRIDDLRRKTNGMCG